jgi:hypothetical protein
MSVRGTGIPVILVNASMIFFVSGVSTIFLMICAPFFINSFVLLAQFISASLILAPACTAPIAKKIKNFLKINEYYYFLIFLKFFRSKEAPCHSQKTKK